MLAQSQPAQASREWDWANWWARRGMDRSALASYGTHHSALGSWQLGCMLKVHHQGIFTASNHKVAQQETHGATGTPDHEGRKFPEEKAAREMKGSKESKKQTSKAQCLEVRSST